MEVGPLVDYAFGAGNSGRGTEPGACLALWMDDLQESKHQPALAHSSIDN